MRAALGVVLINVAMSGLSLAQQAEQSEKPKTKLEAFVAHDGVVIIRRFSRVGDLKGKYNGVVFVECREFTDAATNQREHGIAVEVGPGNDGRERRKAYVDFDEIPALLKGLDYIGKVDKSSTTLDDFEASYRTRGDLVVSTFSESGTTRGLSVSVETIPRTSTFLAIADLERLRSIIQNAHATLEKLRTSSMK